MTTRQDTLYAFYDLSKASPRYDFLVFVRIAEFHRRRYGYANIYFVIVPGFKDGFRDDPWPPNDPVVLHGMVRNIVIPGCWVLPACSGVSYLPSREEALAFLTPGAENVFPRGYTLENPVQDYTVPAINAALFRGEELTPLQAPKEYQDQATAYCQLIAGDKRLIVITLRECSYESQRNSQISEWKKFIDYLDRSQYTVVIVRDTEHAHSPPHFEDVPECPLAAINLCFRLALYEKCNLTMHVNNGPSWVANNALVPSIMFGVYDAEHVASSLEFFKSAMGQSFGDQWYGYPINQRLVWEKDSYEVIKDGFESLISVLDQYPKGDYPPHGFGSATQLFDTCKSVVEYTALKMQYNCMDEDRDVLLRVIELSDGKHPIAINMLGVWYSTMAETDKAVSAFLDSIAADPASMRPYLNLAVAYYNIGQQAPALELFMTILDTFGPDLETVELAVNCAIVAGEMEIARQIISVSQAASLDSPLIQTAKSKLQDTT